MKAPVVFAGLLMASAALADPPPAHSPDSVLLSPYQSWIESQEGPLGNCCSSADGREVEYRITADGEYEVRFVHPEDISNQIPPAAGVWYRVPGRNVLRGANPTGVGVAWWYAIGSGAQGSPIRCFAPAGGV